MNYDLNDVRLRKRRFGWEVRYRVYLRLLTWERDTQWDWRSCWRPTKRWAESVGIKRQRRSQRHVDRQEGEGAYAWISNKSTTEGL